MCNRVWLVQSELTKESLPGCSERETNDGSGFTLIEVVIVIFILAIMSGVAVFALGNQGANSAVSACRVDAKSLESALEEFRTDNNGAYPSGPTSTSSTDSSWADLITAQAGMAGSPFLQNPIPTVNYVLWWVVDPNGQLLIYVDSGVTASALPFTYHPPTANMDFNATNGRACSSYAK